MKNKNEIIVLGVIAIIVTLVMVIVVCVKTNGSAYKSKIEKQSDSIDKREMKDYDVIDIDKYLELYKGKKESIVMIGRTGCEYCQTAEPIIQNIAYRYNLKVYYLSLDTFDDDDKDKLLNSDKYFKDNGGLETPMLLIVKDKKMVDYFTGLAEAKDYEDFLSSNGIIKKK